MSTNTITANGLPGSSVITFSGLCAGNYTFVVSSPPGYSASPASGVIVVPPALAPGSEVYETIQFGPTPPPCNYTVTFNETGLPAGTTWDVVLNGVTMTATLAGTPPGPHSGTSLTFTGLCLGTYTFVVSSPSGYSASPSSGTVVVTTAVVPGGEVYVHETFTYTTPPCKYTATFNETGVPLGKTWDVTLGGVTMTATVGFGVIATVPVGGNPGAATYDPANGDVYVGNYWTANVTVIDGATHHVVQSIPTGGQPSQIAYDPSNGYLYVSNFASNDVTVINGATNHVVTSISVGSGPDGIAFDPANGYLFVSNWFSGSYTVINAATDLVIGTITAGSDPAAVALDLANGHLFVPHYLGTVSVFNGANNALLGTVSVGANPSALAFDPVNGYVYVTNEFSNTVSVINGATDAVVTTVAVGTSPDAVAYDPALGDIFVGNWGSHYVTLINGATDSVVASMGVGDAPSAIAYDLANSYLYVVNSGDDNVSVLAPTGVSITFSGLCVGRTTFTVSTPAGYKASPSSGTVIVPATLAPGSEVYVPIAFSYAPSQYTVTFEQTGLPARAVWGVELNGTVLKGAVSANGSSATLTFSRLSAAGYPFAVSLPHGYVAGPSRGTVTIPSVLPAGTEVYQVIRFEPGTPVTLRFVEKGLTKATEWCAALDNASACSAASHLTIPDLTAGTHLYAVTTVTGYSESVLLNGQPVPSSGSVTLTKRTTAIDVKFTPLLYAVTLNETGLAAGKTWHLKLTCTSSTTNTSGCHGTTAKGSGLATASGGNITLMLRAGTYTWKITPIKGYQLEFDGVADPTWSGSFTVAAHPQHNYIGKVTLIK